MLRSLTWGTICPVFLSLFLACTDCTSQSLPQSYRTDVQIRLVMNTRPSIPRQNSNSVRIAKDPVDNTLYYLKANGDLYQVDLNSRSSRRIYTTADHGLRIVYGMAIGRDGTIYLVANEDITGQKTRGIISRGVRDVAGQREWSVLAYTEEYPLSATSYDHRVSGIAISPDGKYLYVNSGSRTDHGEIQTADGLFPYTREVPLTACILRIPAQGENLYLPNNRELLLNQGYLYAEGIRNSFDLAFAPNGDLLATENGPDRDSSEELNWIREGGHYGFPWTLGGQDNPQRFKDYDPSMDLLLNFDHRSYASIAKGYYRNDTTFPDPPSDFVEPVVNLGPDADSFRDASDGLVKDASDAGVTVSTFTAHRSPLGLVFDHENRLSPEYRGDAFMLSFTRGDATGSSQPGPFHDRGEDLLHLNLIKRDEKYQVVTRRIAGGFNNPIDAEIVGNKIYVIEHGGSQGLWEIIMPTTTDPSISHPLSISLRRGWNLISFAYEPIDPSITEVLGSIAGKYSSVFAFDNVSGTFTRFIPDQPEESSLTTLHSGPGYWINMNENATLVLQRTRRAPAALNLRRGWNLIGYTGSEMGDLTNVLQSISGKYRSVWAWSSTTGRYINYSVEGAAGELKRLEPNRGYYIYSTEDSLLTFSE